MAAEPKTLSQIAGITESVHLSAEDVVAINEGVAQADAGLCIPWEQAKQHLQNRLKDAQTNRPDHPQGT